MLRQEPHPCCASSNSFKIRSVKVALNCRRTAIRTLSAHDQTSSIEATFPSDSSHITIWCTASRTQLVAFFIIVNNSNRFCLWNLGLRAWKGIFGDHYITSNLSRFITLFHTPTKLFTNFSCESSLPYTSAIARS